MTREERVQLSETLRDKKAQLLKQLHQWRPTKDPQFPGEKDREVFMRGKCAELIAEVEHLERLWELERELSDG